MPKIVVSAAGFGQAYPDAITRLNAVATLDLNSRGARYGEKEFLSTLTDATILIAGTEKISNRVLDKARQLQLIARVGVGIDNIDLAYAKAKGIGITYTPQAPSQAIPEFTLALMLNVVKYIHQSDRKMHEGVWFRPMGRMLGSLKVGIVGAGKIGSAVITLLKRVFPNIDLYFYDPFVAQGNLPATKCDLSLLFQTCDLVSLHLPLNDQTRGLIGHTLLSSMKKGSYLVNTARGGIVDEKVLADLLRSGHLAGAAVDVFEQEPYEGPLTEVDNSLLTAHVGSLTQEVRALMEKQVVEDVLRFLRQEPLLRPVPGTDCNKGPVPA